MSKSTNRYTWHPCMQNKDFEQQPPLNITAAQGDYLITDSGQKIIDGIASWWCKSLGHQHPALMQALRAQSERFEHVILANTTNNMIEQLSARLCALTQHCRHVFYASDGSCAVEIAIKMAVHAQQLRGQEQRQQFLALANGYHGETGLALSASDVGIYRQPYQTLLIPMTFIQHIPYVNDRQDPLWHDCASVWPEIEAQLAPHAHTAAAIIVEPLLQGSGGMKIYSPDLLRRLRFWCDEHDVYLIADEIMTGFGRTGKFFACEHANIEADLICLAKGMTAGVLPLSATLTTEAIYQLFYDDYASGKAFLHSHTHCGNALAVAVAHEVLNVTARENIVARAAELESQLSQRMHAVADATGCLENIRALGGMVAAELKPHPHITRVGYAVHCQALALGALIRPIANTLYWFPPLNAAMQTLDELQEITVASIKKVFC